MPLPLTANKSSHIDGDGTWHLIASSGSVLTHAKEPVPYAYTPDANEPEEDVRGHPMEFQGKEVYRYAPTLSTGQWLWMKPDKGVRVEVTITVAV